MLHLPIFIDWCVTCLNEYVIYYLWVCRTIGGANIRWFSALTRINDFHRSFWGTHYFEWSPYLYKVYVLYIYKHKFTYVCTCLHKLGGQHWQCYFCMFHKTRYCWTTNLHQLKWITHLETGNLIYYETAIQLLRVSYWQGFLLTSPRHGLFWWTASLSCQNLLVHLHGFVLGSEIRFSCCKKWKG